MFELIFFSILSVIIVTPCGYFFKKHDNNITNLSNYLIYGIILISFITLVINFIFPLNHFVNTLILILPILIILKNIKTYLSINFLKFLIFNVIIIVLLVSKSNIYRPDAILYHLPYTGILNNEEIIFGLSNIHFRFATTSIIQYLSAVQNNYLYDLEAISVPIASIFTFSIIFIFQQLHKNIKSQQIFNSIIIFLICIFIIYLLVKFIFLCETCISLIN